jgi:hypothetical protein
VRFNDGPLAVYWQYLDPFLLRQRLGQSLFYLHSQPPLFNLFLGLALKTGQERAVLVTTYLLCGLAVYAGTFTLMRRLSVSPWVAFAVATWWATSPALVAYENWLFYTLPVAALLALVVLAFERATRHGRARDGFAFAIAVFVLCAMRSLYHLVYLLAALGWLALSWRSWRRAAAAGALPLVLLSALYAKNAVLFGHFEASTWTGMNLARLTTEALEPGDAARLVAQGTLRPVSLVPAFSRPEAYPSAYFDTESGPRARALTWPTKTTGAANFNHLGYVAISDDYLRDAGWVIRHRPATYLASVGRAWEVYFRSPSDLRFLGIANIDALRPATDAYDVVFFGRWPWPDRSRAGDAPRYWLLRLGLPLVLAYGVICALGRSGGRGLDRSQRIALGFLCFNIAYVALVGNLLELGENNRFRFETDPLSLCLLGLLLDRSLVPRARRLVARA